MRTAEDLNRARVAAPAGENVQECCTTPGNLMWADDPQREELKRGTCRVCNRRHLRLLMEPMRMQSQGVALG